MPEVIRIAELTQLTTECLQIRRANFVDEITFHAPGLRRYKTDEFDSQNAIEFASEGNRVTGPPSSARSPAG